MIYCFGEEKIYENSSWSFSEGMSESFSVYGPSLWNQLPISIRSSTVCTFKQGLKTHVLVYSV